MRERLTELGYDVTARRDLTLPGAARRSRNVVGQTPGPIEVVIVAHMDGVPHTSAANDNASGVGVMLMLAQYLQDEPGVLVAALGAEERRLHRGGVAPRVAQADAIVLGG